MAQYAVLRALADQPQASAAELARLCFVTGQSLQDVRGGLRTAALVEDSGAPPRGRAHALQLTPTGKRRLAQAHAVVTGVEQDMLAGMSGKDRWLRRAARQRRSDRRALVAVPPPDELSQHLHRPGGRVLCSGGVPAGAGPRRRG